MNILICPDKFKFTFSALQIAKIIKQTVEKMGHKAIIAPLADGGEGFLEVILNYIQAKKVFITSLDPILKPINSYFLWNKDDKRAYLELALIGSLQLLKLEQRNPLNTTTIGLGIIINKAIDLGAEEILIGLGGSSTTEMGMGMAEVLGYSFYDWQKNKLFPIGRNMIKVQQIISKNKYFPRITAYVDVNNLLYGPQGAAMVYGQQKGAKPNEVLLLDRGLRNLAQVAEDFLGCKLNSSLGEGAAGGLGAGIKAFLFGKILFGAEFVFDIANLEQKITWADLIITGEGSFDEQSLRGKVSGMVIEKAKKFNKKVIVLAGISKISNTDNFYVIPLFKTKVNINVAREQTPQRIEEKLQTFFSEYL